MTAVVDNPASPRHTNHLISTNGRIAIAVSEPPPNIRVMPREVELQLTKMCRSSRYERCGFLTTDWDIHEVQNVHEEPTHNFYMENEDAANTILSIYNDLGTAIAGIFHTHPNNVPWPSPRDICGWPNPALKWRYFVVTANKVGEWVLG